MVGTMEMTELCHRCHRVPMVTTVSDGAREVALGLGCLRTLVFDAEGVWRPKRPRMSERDAWRGVLERVGEEE